MAVPSIVDVRAWLKVTPAQASDDDLSLVLLAELDNQGRACRWVGVEFPDVLKAAILRRCARHWAARQVALGIVGAGDEYGPTRLTQYDAEIERLERPWRRVVAG